jgi:diguanylate cyclase (GGDEF)-like protein
MAIFDKKKLQKMKEMELKDKKHTIMIVDDEEAHLSSTESLLSEDYHIITARNGQEALDIIQKMDKREELSVIISDQRMPGLTGIELFKKLIPILPKTIRIILTGYIDIPVIIDAVNKTQIYQFIQKPFEPEDLKLRIKGAIKAFEREKELEDNRHTLEERNKELVQKNKELEEVLKKLEEAILIDPLTGLRNRLYINKFIHSEISKIQRYYESNLQDFSKARYSQNDIIFLLLDPDDFKSINDNFGYEVGNMVLKKLAEILKKECRQSDILVRWSGDEFLSVIYIDDMRQAQQHVERMRQAVENNKFDLGQGKTCRLTCSIGFAPYPFLPKQPGLINWERVVAFAIEALHAAKNSGGNAWVGILATDNTKTEKLFDRILENTNELITNGELKILTSIADKNALVWKKHELISKKRGK